MNALTKYWNGNNDEPSDRNAEEVVGWLDAYERIKYCHTIADLGCGTGNITHFCRDKGHDAFGITYQAKEVDYAESLGRDYIYLGDMHELPFDDCSFEACISFDSLEHCSSMLTALSEMKRILISGGIAVIFIPGESWIEFPFHIIVPTIRQMTHLINLVDFELVELILFDPQKWSAQQATYILRKK